MTVSQLIARLQKLPPDQPIGVYKLSMIPGPEWVFMPIKYVERRSGRPVKGLNPKQYVITDAKADQAFVTLDSANPFA